MPSRRQLLLGLAALSTTAALPGLSLASLPGSQRLVVVVMRGGLDGLALLPPHGDPRYTASRGRAALPGPGESKGIIDLDGFFGLHPALAPLLPLWKAGELAGVHAMGLPNTERSHFEAQDMLEGGGSSPRAMKTGWLNRALGTLPAASGPPTAVAIGKGVPLILRGEAPVTSIQPDGDTDSDADFLTMVAALYDNDPTLSAALQQGLMSRQMISESTTGRRKSGNRQQARTTGELLAHPEGPRIAVMEVGGFDTHANQRSVLTNRLGRLSDGILGLQEGLGSAWQQTVVVMITEFGRTVAANGTNGTDHGTGAAALLMGGAIAGGRIHSDWPGLTRLHDDRDLKVTTDLRSMLKGVLRDHLAIEDRLIFPDSPPALGGLLKAT